MSVTKLVPDARVLFVPARVFRCPLVPDLHSFLMSPSIEWGKGALVPGSTVNMVGDTLIRIRCEWVRHGVCVCMCVCCAVSDCAYGFLLLCSIRLLVVS